MHEDPRQDRTAAEGSLGALRCGLVALVALGCFASTAATAATAATAVTSATVGPADPADPAGGTGGTGASARWRILDGLPTRGESVSALAATPAAADAAPEVAPDAAIHAALDAAPRAASDSVDAAAGLAAGDEGGVSWWRAGGWSRAQTPAVRDLAFDAAGQLWIASESGLFVWAPEGRPQRRTLRGGELANRVARIEVLGPLVALASEAGVFVAVAGSPFQALSSGSAGQAVSLVALARGRALDPASTARASSSASAAAPGARAGAVWSEIWSYGIEGLVRVRGLEASSGLRVLDRVLWPLPRPAIEAGPVDLVVDAGRERLFVVYPDAIAEQSLAQTDARAPRWRWIRPVLPPGALIRRLVVDVAGRDWLATDHGLLEAAEAGVRFERAASPAGGRACGDVASGASLASGALAVALCRGGLLVLGPAAQGPLAAVGSPVSLPEAGAGQADAGSPAPAVELPADPPLAEIRRRALARAGLTAERAERLWKGLRGRALLPSVELRGDYDADRDRVRRFDQSFVSGDTRGLFERDRAKGSHRGAAIVLDWQLEELSYPDQTVELSRELRQVTSLRDDVADEIHQLYFERQRIRTRLARPPAPSPEEATELVLRAEELDAGLDAWTGGWISAWRAQPAGRRPSDHPGRLDRSNDR